MGETGERASILDGFKPLGIVTKWRGTRQVTRTDRYGFPRGKAGQIKRAQGLITRNIAGLVQLFGKYMGVHVGRLAGICADGRLGIAAKAEKIAASHKKFSLLQQSRWVRLCDLAAGEKMAATAKRGGWSPCSGRSRRALGLKQTRLAPYATVQAHRVVAHSCALS